jgi:hypothetical protein
MLKREAMRGYEKWFSRVIVALNMARSLPPMSFSKMR